MLSHPLTDMLKKNTIFVWTPIAEATFRALKQALIKAPVLALPDFKKRFVLERYARASKIEAILMQDSHPVSKLIEYSFTLIMSFMQGFMLTGLFPVHRYIW